MIMFEKTTISVEWRLDCLGAVWLASLFKGSGIHLCAAEDRS